MIGMKGPAKCVCLLFAALLGCTTKTAGPSAFFGGIGSAAARPTSADITATTVRNVVVDMLQRSAVTVE